MENRVALVSIIVKDLSVVDELNETLHQYSSFIIGRLGIPYREKDMYIISVAMDAPSDIINALSGKLGRIESVSSKVVYANE